MIDNNHMANQTISITTISVIFVILLSLSIYGGYSDKATIFCIKDAAFPSVSVGPNGLVTQWLRIFSTFLIITMALFVILAVVAYRTFNLEDYKLWKKEDFDLNHQQPEVTYRLLTTPNPLQYTFESWGYDAIDAFHVYEMYNYNIFNILIIFVMIFWFVFVVYGLIMLRLYVPYQCTYNTLGDNTSLFVMYSVIFLSLIPYIICLVQYH